MAQKIIYKKRFLNKLDKLLIYLQIEWGHKAALDFIENLEEKIKFVKKQPEIGAVTIYKNVRSILVAR